MRGIMKRLVICILSISSTALFLSGNALPGAIPAQIQQVLEQGQRSVIVVLRDQMPSVPPVRRAMGARAAALANSQNSVLAGFPQMRSRKLQSFSTINAFAATVSSAEAEQLAGHPMVRAVVPDTPIRLPLRKSIREPSGQSAIGPASLSALSATDGGLCNTLEPEALQVTNTAFADPSVPQAQQVRDGNGQLVTGKGVKVAFIAGVIDINNPGFIRPDGSPVFIDFQDFTGNPAFGGGAEAFGDASSIAAQDMPNGKPLLFDISQFVNPAHPLPAPCNIRIRGMAPGASLVGLDVEGAGATISTVIQAIEYAVIHDDVDVINESFGFERYPDNDDNVIALANDAAVAAGVTVVSLTGDAGPGTINAPGSESSVILVGASTTFRAYAQTGDGVIPLTKNSGFISNNISALSGSGFSQKDARTVDVVAPGDDGWSLCSANQAMFSDCADNTAAFGPSPIQVFSGTSQSAPLTAGEAALVIQAYRSTHGGTDPSPARVKQIIMSTATDLGAPSSEQGAGLINALAAVNLALSIDDEHGKAKSRGNGLVIAPGSAHITAEPNRLETRSFTITNAGATSRQLTPSLETLAAPFDGATMQLNLEPSNDPVFIEVFGFTRAYTTRTFKVPANADHLDAAMAFKNPISTAFSAVPPQVWLGLIDPSGRQAAYSYPQGVGGNGYAHVDVVKPQAGNWTAVFYTYKNSVFRYTGPIQFSWSAERYTRIGSVYPAHLDLRPGESASITATFPMPSQSGDLAAAIRFDASPGASMAFPEIPITLRTVIPTGPTGGNFTGTLTGGNQRPGSGPYQTFAFDVPKGVNDMSLVLNLTDNGYLLGGFLVDPNGMFLSMMPNQDPLDGSPLFAMTLSHYNPQPGRWKFVLVQNFISSGNQTSLPFTARIGFNTAQITAPTLPNDASVTLSASGAPLTVPIQITNTGAVTKLYFADARLDISTILQLIPQGFGPVNSLPGGFANFILPTQVSAAAFIAQSTVPITMEAESFLDTGAAFVSFSPDILAQTIAPNTVQALIREPEVPYSFWFVPSSLVGPFGPLGAPTAPLSTSAFVLTQAFDAAVSADSGDLWFDANSSASTFNPLVLAPGASGTINLSIAPDSSKVGQTISGFLYVDTFDFNVFTGDEVVRIPYRYTVAP
jgi:hypothetical protein